MSQLGMMVIAVGLSCYNIALFHLVNHAFYKALLFLGAGSVIHAVADNQDFRRYGGLRHFLPLTYSVMLIASLSLVAFPFMTGFYSKDFILESAFGQYYFSSTVVYIIATIGAMFTTLYSVKVLYLTFLTNPNGPLINYKQAHEGDIFMSLPLIILAVFSIFFGFVTKDMFIGLGSGFFADNALFIHPTHEIMLDTEFGVPTVFKLLPLLFTIVISFIFIVLTEFLSSALIYFKLSRLGYNIFSFFNQRFLIELFYNKYITGVILKLGGVSTKIIDKGAVEYLGPYGLEKGLSRISYNIGYLNTGVITSYALYITTGLIFYILFSFYLKSVIIILGIIMSLYYNLNYTHTYVPQRFTLLYKSGISYNFKVYSFIILVVIILTLLNQESIMCHSPDFTEEDHKKILECKHNSGFTRIDPTSFPGLKTPLCDVIPEGTSYTRQLVYHQAHSGALEPYFKCNNCPAHICGSCYVGNIVLFIVNYKNVTLGLKS
jgi:NADH-ubiquinone oxidoreductase chain 5